MNALRYVLLVVLTAVCASSQPTLPTPETGRLVPLRPPEHLVWGESQQHEAPKGQTPDPATAALIQALGQDADTTTRARALEARLLGPESFDPYTFLADWLAISPGDQQRLAGLIPPEDEPALAGAVIEVLKADGPDRYALEAALPALQGPLEALYLGRVVDEETPWLDRVWGVYALGRIGSRGAVPIFEEGLESENADYAYACAEALFQVRPPTFANRWPELVNHPVPGVQWVALVALTNLGGEEAFDVLSRMALGETDHNLAFREQALNGISYWPKYRCIPVLIAALDRERPLQSRAMDHLRALTGLDFERHPEMWVQWYGGVAPTEGENAMAPPLVAGSGNTLLDTVDFVPPGF